MAPERLIAEQQPSSVRITDSNGLKMILKSPMVVRDSIVSSNAVVAGAAFQPPRFGVLSADISGVETARFSPVKTIGFIGMMAAVSIGWASAAGAGGGKGEPVPPDPKGFALSLLSGVRFVLALPR